MALDLTTGDGLRDLVLKGDNFFFLGLTTGR